MDRRREEGREGYLRDTFLKIDNIQGKYWITF